MNPRTRLACATGLSQLIGELTGCRGEGPIQAAAVNGLDDFLCAVLSKAGLGESALPERGDVRRTAVRPSEFTQAVTAARP